MSVWCALQGVHGLSFGLLVYTWFVYPFLLWVANLGVRRGVRKAQDAEREAERVDAAVADRAVDGVECPRVAVLMSAYNEAAGIRARIENLLDMDYPCGSVAILVGDDASTDGTAAAVRAVGDMDSRVRLFEFGRRRGKVAVLRDLVARLPGGSCPTSDRGAQSPPVPELLVFTDANTFFRRDTVRRLAAPFADPGVGGVCGRLVLRGEQEEGTYWRLETWMKRQESALDSCLGANGAVYAVRRDLFWSGIPENTIVDDFVIGMKVREAGCRVLYESEAVAEEDLPETRDEWRRRVRIGAGDYQAMVLCRRLLSPAFGWFAWSFWSHKVLRWFTPHLLALFAGAGVVLFFHAWSNARWGLGAMAAQDVAVAVGVLFVLALGAAAAVGRWARAAGSSWLSAFRLCDHFVTMQAALFCGFLRFCSGRLQGYWQRTPRAGSSG
jgi:cellulose synthase/poly-beta-1,6-N-acetylglucosamine synthase-like glycosyltransferase